MFVTPADNLERAMHPSTYEYLNPTDEQKAAMAKLREAAAVYGAALEEHMPDGPDKTFVIRAHRSNATLAQMAVTRHPDGTLRT